MCLYTENGQSDLQQTINKQDKQYLRQPNLSMAHLDVFLEDKADRIVFRLT